MTSPKSIFDLRATVPCPLSEHLSPRLVGDPLLNELEHPVDSMLGIGKQEMRGFCTRLSLQKHVILFSPTGQCADEDGLVPVHVMPLDLNNCTPSPIPSFMLPLDLQHGFNRLAIALLYAIRESYTIFHLYPKHLKLFSEACCTARYLLRLQTSIQEEAQQASDSGELTDQWMSAYLNRFLHRLHFNVPHSVFGRIQFDAIVGAGHYEAVDAACILGDYCCLLFTGRIADFNHSDWNTFNAYWMQWSQYKYLGWPSSILLQENWCVREDLTGMKPGVLDMDKKRMIFHTGSYPLSFELEDDYASATSCTFQNVSMGEDEAVLTAYHELYPVEQEPMVCLTCDQLSPILTWVYLRNLHRILRNLHRILRNLHRNLNSLRILNLLLLFCL
jgi:hypothetical protein